MRFRSMAVFVVSLVLFVALFTTTGQAAEVDNFAGAGVSWNQYSAPQISGNLIYAHKLGDGTYSFTIVDVVSKTVKPFTVSTVVSTGIAKRIPGFQLGNVYLYGIATVGLAAGSTNAGYALTGGGGPYIPIGKKGFALIPNVRFLKGSLNDLQTVYGISLGWGK